ncbi:MAG: hypothetical protein GXC76_03340 [Rhodanobacteraceae bacterium]|nr:hypothetical protein [Rhodanobacteraceae bacterium]
MEQNGFRVTTLAHAPGFVAVRSGAELRIAGPATVVFELLESGCGFLALTAFRLAASVQENVEAFLAVPGCLRARLGRRSPGYWLIAHWRDAADRRCHASGSGPEGQVTSGAEYLWLVPKPQGVEDGDWVAAAESLATETGQGAFVIRRAQDRQAEVRGTDGRVWATLDATAEVMSALGDLAHARARTGTLERERIRDLLQRGSVADAAASGEAATGSSDVVLSVATAHSIGTHWLFKHIDALPGPRL